MRFCLCASAVVLPVAACVEPIVSLKPGARSYTAGDYERVYERWTREQRSFDFGRLRSVLNVTATFESRDFRWAYVVRYGEDFGLRCVDGDVGVRFEHLAVTHPPT